VVASASHGDAAVTRTVSGTVHPPGFGLAARRFEPPCLADRGLQEYTLPITLTKQTQMRAGSSTRCRWRIPGPAAHVRGALQRRRRQRAAARADRVERGPAMTTSSRARLSASHWPSADPPPRRGGTRKDPRAASERVRTGKHGGGQRHPERAGRRGASVVAIPHAARSRRWTRSSWSAMARCGGLDGSTSFLRMHDAAEGPPSYKLYELRVRPVRGGGWRR
jgi:hypothetical protein